jgi:hypothetical protein
MIDAKELHSDMNKKPSLRKDGSGIVEEVLGVEGPYSFPEKLFQRIWARREFDARDARTADGRRMKIVHPGLWNHLGGPDFREAMIEIEGELRTGDVELHLRVQDWAAHAHSSDPAYAKVVLHVVLFPPGAVSTAGFGGKSIPVFVLLPRLFHDLEEYASNAAIESLANRPAFRLIEELASIPREQIREQFQRHAETRWAEKVRFASMRIVKLGWVEACHHCLLEIFGYRYNRAPMLRLASCYPLRQWSSGEFVIEQGLLAERSGWSLQGVRPANRPQVRLQQYAAWARSLPDWPHRLRNARGFGAVGGGAWPTSGVTDTALIRRESDFSSLREWWRTEICGGVVGGTRLDSMICDGFLPLLAAVDPSGGRVWGEYWTHWYPGDLPELVRPGLRDLGLVRGGRQPLTQGLAQGLLGWLIERERRR